MYEQLDYKHFSNCYDQHFVVVVVAAAAAVVVVLLQGCDTII